MTLDTVCLLFLYERKVKGSKHFRELDKVLFESDIYLIDDEPTERIRFTMLNHIQLLLPHPMHPDIDNAHKVLNHVFKEILKIDGRFRDLWESQYEAEMQKVKTDPPRPEFLNYFARLIAAALELDSVDPSSIMGIFFRVPSWLTPLLKFILEHDTGVQDCLLCYGYRSFAWLNLTAGAAQGP